LVRASREAQLKSTEGMPVYRDYPEKGMKWYELALGDLPPSYTREPSGVYVSPTGERSIHHPNYAKLEDALKYEGDILSHCVGGYCPRVASGESRIFSLRNEAGQPFATVEVQPNKTFLSPLDFLNRSPSLSKSLDEADAVKRLNTRDEIESFVKNSPEYQEYLASAAPSKIVQIKGFKNQAPDESVLPLIQDFVRSGKWEDVGDFENTGLIRIDPSSGLASGLSKKGIEVPSYVTNEE
jgi:hypothetical protein